ncbi:unnamed protein product [Sympodiomycopsis kandeliae]
MASQGANPAHMDEKVSADSPDEKNGHELQGTVSVNEDVEVKKPEELQRGLSPRQISMIAIGGAIGTGLVIGSGTALRQAGPIGLFISYIVMGLVCCGVLTALGELAAHQPHKKGFAGWGGQYVDEAFGFAIGVNYLCKYLVLVPNQLNATALLIAYWRPDLSGAIWISVFALVIITLNIWGGVRVFGEIEYWLSFVKIIVLIGLIILSICINAGAGDGDYYGFRNWTNGRGFQEYKATGALGRFLGTWSAMTLALFAYTGSELPAVAVAEAKNPRKAIPKAIRSTFYRILFFYIILILLVGLIVPADSPELLGATKSKSNASASPFVVAIKIAGINALPGILNACFLVFTFSAANSDLYVASRTLYGLSKSGMMPRWFLIVDKKGTPYVALIFCSLFIALGYITVGSDGATAFGYLTSSVTVFGGLTWWALLIVHMRFMAGMKAQGKDRNKLAYKSPFQPYFGWYSLFVITLVLIFKGFQTFIPKFDHKSFITQYIGIPIFVLLYVGWKIYYKTKFIRASEMDLVTGARELTDVDDEDEDEVDKTGWTWKQRVVHFFKAI